MLDDNMKQFYQFTLSTHSTLLTPSGNNIPQFFVFLEEPLQRFLSVLNVPPFLASLPLKSQTVQAPSF